MSRAYVKQDLRLDLRLERRDERDAGKHAEMGLHEGWGNALDQLVAEAMKM